MQLERAERAPRGPPDCAWRRRQGPASAGPCELPYWIFISSTAHRAWPRPGPVPLRPPTSGGRRCARLLISLPSTKITGKTGSIQVPLDGSPRLVLFPDQVHKHLSSLSARMTITCIFDGEKEHARVVHQWRGPAWPARASLAAPGPRRGGA